MLNNEPTTPTSIKSDFANALALGVGIKESTVQSRNDALLKFKFEPKHFSEIKKERSNNKKTMFQSLLSLVLQSYVIKTKKTR